MGAGLSCSHGDFVELTVGLQRNFKWLTAFCQVKGVAAVAYKTDHQGGFVRRPGQLKTSLDIGGYARCGVGPVHIGARHRLFTTLCYFYYLSAYPRRCIGFQCLKTWSQHEKGQKECR